jgi:GH35 family endo-1,4-beta-xylanase
MLHSATKLALCFLSACAWVSAARGQSLREQATRAGMLIGTAVRADQLKEATYTEPLAREFNMVEAEDAMKWWVIRPAPETFDFAQGDRIAAFAHAHGMKVRGHTLVWGRSNPQWLSEQKRTPTQLSALLHEHIARVVSHYRGKVFAWDVVNEGFDEHGDVRPTIWYNQPGIGLAGNSTGYIEQALQWAHAADPAALLFDNEAEAETLNPKSDAIYAMVRDFRRRGVPIDGVGLQMHVFDLHPDLAGIDRNIGRFAALGSRCTLQKWMSRFRRTRTGTFATRTTCRSRLKSTGRSPRSAGLTRTARRFRRGVSLINTHGSVPARRAPRARRCSSIATMQRSQPMQP